MLSRAALYVLTCATVFFVGELVFPGHDAPRRLTVAALTWGFLIHTAMSERRFRAEHTSLVAAEERFRLSFEAAPIGVALVNPDGRFLRANEALCRLVGYSEEELLPLTFAEITHPDDLAADIELLQETLRGERDHYRLEKRYLHREGHAVAAQLDVSLVRDSDGEPLHFISHIQDVTERSQILGDLRRSQLLQQASLDALEQGVGVLSTEWEVLLLNPAGERILGYTAAEMTQRLQTGLWESYDELGGELSVEDRPLLHSLVTGEPLKDRVMGYRDGGGELRVLRLATEPYYDASGTMLGVVVAFADITQQRAAERAEREAMAQLQWQAFHDTLTGLPNRARLLERLEGRLAAAPDRPTALLFIDLDHFKVVNDTMGHRAGDELLVAVGDRISAVVRDADTVARFGGDEFVVLAEDVTSRRDAVELAERIAEALEQPIVLAAGPVRASVSIGIAYDGGLTPDDLLRDADIALYQAKQGGRSRHELFAGGNRGRADDTAVGQPWKDGYPQVTPGGGSPVP